MLQKLTEFIPAAQDQILTFPKLGTRWACHPKVAARRAKQLRLPILRFNARALGVRLSDVLRAEADATAEIKVSAPKAEEDINNEPPTEISEYE